MRMKREIEQEDGWSRWVPAQMKGYRMGCCDCSLVHDMEFQVVKVIEDLGGGLFTHGKPLNPEKYRVMFRARRNKRSTAAMRRAKPAETRPQ